MPTESLLKKVLLGHDELNAELVEREAEVHAAWLAVVTGSHLFLLGEPGISKSLLVERLALRIEEANYFAVLLNNFSGPETVFGPLNLAALRTGTYIRLTDRYLPWAHFAFIDEVWRSNDSILNAMLLAFNERKFDNNGRHKIPLSTAFLASNELPQNESLNAIYDRVAQRRLVRKIQEPQSMKDMLKLNIPEEVDPILTWGEIEQIKAEVRAVKVDDSVYDTLVNIRRELDKINIFPSDRRIKQSINILQGEAWLDGVDTVTPDHITIVVNCYWDRPEQISQVEEVVLQLANPLEKSTLELLNEIGKIGDLLTKAMDSQDDDERQRLGIEIHPKVKKASEEYHDLAKKAGESRRQQALLETCKKKLHTHSEVLIESVFNLPPGTNPAI